MLRKNIKIGLNNMIEKYVKIHDNVIIGNNNKIYNGTVIYPNTIIGDNNVILNDNILGEHPVEAKESFTSKVFNGLVIGDNNLFHVKNLIFNGYHRKTEIGCNNKLLAENHIGHDTIITNNVVLYPRCITGGLSKLMPYSTMGMNSIIQQNTILGHYAMVGMGNISSHNVFPFYIYVNNKYLRFNKVKIPNELNIDNYDIELRKIIDSLKNNFDKEIIINSELPYSIKIILVDFYDSIKIKKI
jgi:UDP-N-acetylglucosamine acyltransferase